MRKDDVKQAIEKLMLEKGYPPTVREIGQELGMKSTSTVHAHLMELLNDGVLEEDYPRTIRVKGFKYERNKHAKNNNSNYDIGCINFDIKQC